MPKPIMPHDLPPIATSDNGVVYVQANTFGVCLQLTRGGRPSLDVTLDRDAVCSLIIALGAALHYYREAGPS